MRILLADDDSEDRDFFKEALLEIIPSQFLDWLCSRPKFNGIDKIVWSTAYDKKYIDDCRGKGAIEYFVKANDYDGIKSIVQKILAYCNYHPDIEVMPQAQPVFSP